MADRGNVESAWWSVIVVSRIKMNFNRTEMYILNYEQGDQLAGVFRCRATKFLIK